MGEAVGASCDESDCHFVVVCIAKNGRIGWRIFVEMFWMSQWLGSEIIREFLCMSQARMATSSYKFLIHQMGTF